MNFDNIKAAWDEQAAHNVQVPASIEQLHRANHIVAKIGRNIHHELKWQIVAVVLLGFLPQLFKLSIALYDASMRCIH